jgi:hypothetical protein
LVDGKEQLGGLRGERSHPAAARYDDKRCGIIAITLQPLDDNESCSGTQGFE